ncbi:mucin-2-like [Ylistrum balloti]|uniref:mucin-2-like n=1 Tax=Ylistrum balloti TaxID=509963 RepID=UPI002905900C|nr:mucin-2-like [Ylistrum balloti]
MEQRIIRKFLERQTGNTFRNRPGEAVPRSVLQISPSFSMPVLPKIEIPKKDNLTVKEYLPTTTPEPQYRVESAVVSKPFEVPGWMQLSNGKRPGQWQRNMNRQGFDNNARQGPVYRSDEYIYMINGHPARQQDNTRGNEPSKKKPQRNNLNGKTGRQYFQLNSNNVNKRQPSINSHPRNSNHIKQNGGQFQNINNNKNTVHSTFPQNSNKVISRQNTRMFQQTINSRKAGGIANSNDLNKPKRNTAGEQGGLKTFSSDGALTLTNGQWSNGAMSSPDVLENMMTLTPNENSIGMNRQHTTTNKEYTRSLPSTLPVRIPQDGHLLPSVMPQLSPTRRSEPPLQSGHARHQIIVTSGLAEIPQSRQFVNNPVRINKAPLPSPRPTVMSPDNLQIVKQSNPRPTSINGEQPTPGFNRSPIPPIYISDPRRHPLTVQVEAKKMQENGKISTRRHNEPMAHLRHSIGIMTPPVERMELRKISRQNMKPKSVNGQSRLSKPTQRQSNGLISNSRRPLRPDQTPEQHNRLKPPRRQHMKPNQIMPARPSPPPGRRIIPTPGLNPTKRPMPTTRNIMVAEMQHLGKPRQSPIGYKSIPLLPGGLLVTSKRPSMPLNGNIAATALPVKALKQSWSSLPPTGPLVRAMSSSVPIRKKINSKMQSLSSNRASPLPSRRQNMGPLGNPIRSKRPIIGVNMRPAASSLGLRIAPSQRPLLQDWPQPSTTSLILPSVQPTRSDAESVDVVQGQAYSNGYTKTSDLEKSTDVSSNYVSMTWLRPQNQGISSRPDQSIIDHVSISKSRFDDDNGYKKSTRHENNSGKGENSGKVKAKFPHASKNDITIPISKGAVIASPFNPKPVRYVIGSKPIFTTESPLRKESVTKLTPTPSKDVTSLENGTIANFNMFLIPTRNNVVTEQIPVNNKTMSTTEAATNTGKGSTSEKNNATEPVITSKLSEEQPMRIFDINAFSIIRSKYLPIQTTETMTTATSTSTLSSTASSSSTRRQSSPVSASKQNIIASTTSDTRTPTAYNSVAKTTMTDTTKETTNKATVTTMSEQPVVRKNKNVIPPALQEMMDALKQSGFQAGVPINLNQIPATGTETTDSPKSFGMIELTDGMNKGNTIDMSPKEELQGSRMTTTVETTIPTSTTPPITPSESTMTPGLKTLLTTATEVTPSTLPLDSLKSGPPSSKRYHVQGKQHDLYDSPLVPYLTTTSIPVHKTKSPLLVDNNLVKESSTIEVVPSIKPTTDTSQGKTSSDQTKTSVFFGLWSTKPQNYSSTVGIKTVEPTISSTAESYTINALKSSSTMKISSHETHGVSIENPIDPTAFSTIATYTKSTSSKDLKGKESVLDAGYDIMPVTNLMSEDLKKNITNLRRQLGDFIVPSSINPYTETSKTNEASASMPSDQNQQEGSIAQSKGYGRQEPVKSGITAGVGVHTEPSTPIEPVPVQSPALANNDDLLNMFGVRNNNSPYQGIIIDSSFTMTFPTVSSTPAPPPKGTYGASDNVNAEKREPSSHFDVQKQTPESSSNFDTQKQPQQPTSIFNIERRTQEYQPISEAQPEAKEFPSHFPVQTKTQKPQSNLSVQPPAKITRSNIPKSGNSITTLFEVPYFFNHMSSPFSNEDAGVKHRFVQPKTLQNVDKPFETATNAPVYTTAAPKTRKVVSQPSESKAQTSMVDTKYDSPRGNKHSKSVKKDINKSKPKKTNTILFQAAGHGMPGNANFMEHLPFFVGSMDSKMFNGMQARDNRASSSQNPPRKRSQRTTSTPMVASSSTRTTSLSTTQQSKLKIEYDLKVLCMQFLKSTIKDQTFIPHPGDCSKIIQCSSNENEMQAVSRHCPFGLFWDPNTQRCGDPSDVTCFDDPCQKGYFNYSSHGGCGTYNKCFAGVSVPTCCPSGQRFAQTSSDAGECIWDTTCSEPCETLQSSTLRKTGGCPTLEVESRKDVYWILQRGSLVLKKCPVGYMYKHSECKCKTTTRHRPTTKSTPNCKPEFKLTFDGGIIKDVSGGGLAFSQVNVAGTGNNTAVFRENGYISLWGFQNRYLGRTFSIRMRVRADKGSCRTGGRSIVSNCGPDGPTSVEIACDNNKISFKANTDNTKVPPVILRDIKDNEWADIIYTYKANKFSGSVNDRSLSKSLTGNLVSRNNPLIIGKCPKSPGFIGEMDQLEIYTQCAR